MNLNENIRKLRTAKGINQVEFAKRMGVTKQCVSNWENDNILPSVEMLVKIADFFCVSTDYLLGLSDRKTLIVEGLTDEELSYIQGIIKSITAPRNERK